MAYSSHLHGFFVFFCSYLCLFSPLNAEWGIHDGHTSNFLNNQIQKDKNGGCASTYGLFTESPKIILSASQTATKGRRVVLLPFAIQMRCRGICAARCTLKPSLQRVHSNPRHRGQAPYTPIVNATE